jgi:glycosyltransferase involved in cell wall biosynthesis
MSEYYIFFTRDTLPQPEAHIVHDVNTANAAANLGYPAVLVYLNQRYKSFNPAHWFHAFQPDKPSVELIKYYSLQKHLKVIPLAMPWPISARGKKWTHISTAICKYYFPLHIFPHTKILHTLDWNLVKVAIKSGIPVIYEREHDRQQNYEPEIVNSPLFQVAITVADSVKNNLIAKGMPPEKIVKLHLSFNQSFSIGQIESAQQWRKQLLSKNEQKLVVYSGGLYKFKGVDLLLEVAGQLPEIQFVFAGGTGDRLNYYQQQARDKQLNNVTFLGYIQHDRLPSLLQAADILAHPHLSGEAATFTSPLKFFEYLASGVAIVATTIPPLQEFQTANIMAGWCETDSVRAYINCLQHTLERYPRQPSGYSQQIDFARQFSWESRMSKIMSYVDPAFQPNIIN